LTTTDHLTPPTPAVHARRVIFIDLGRALAVVFMLYGHTGTALLAPAYQAGPWFEAWQFQRGLTSSLFLLLGGFAFSIATSRHWVSHIRVSGALVRRLRRFGLFILLGYALHFPVGSVLDLPGISEARWRGFVMVDVLQLIGLTLIVTQLLVLVSQHRHVFTIAAVTLAGAIIAATPFVWAADWAASLPVALAAYFSPAVGSIFPIFPWMSMVLLGAAFGQIYARWGAANLTAYARRALILPGTAMLAASGILRLAADPLFGTGAGAIVPSQVLLRVGVCLILLAGIAHLSRRMTSLPHVFGAVAQESLLIYFVHLCLVYGSVWNHGLVHLYGASLGPAATLFWVIAVVASMVALAWYWNWWKHARPRAARWTSIAALTYLFVRLL
jgi:uncharacterized membrane protein